jgi:alcohol dehydrogenase (NADP+)
MSEMTKIKAYGARAADQPLQPMTIERRAPGPHDVLIDIAFCGVCHSDLHQARSEWQGTLYPCVPGHEIVGYVAGVGEAVTKFKIGDAVGVGCMVDSCQHCGACDEGLEQYCVNGFTATYNSPINEPSGHTLGGYSQQIVVDDTFVLRISHPTGQLPAVAPLLCAGITTYSPLRHWKAGPGKKIGIVGIGGLGHVGIKIAHAMGAHVIAFTGSEDKRADARRLGAHEVVVTKNANAMAGHANELDFILDTVAASHDLTPFVSLLKLDGTMALVGVPERAHPSPDAAALIFRRRAIAGSLIGGIAETQEMLDFCAKHEIVADIETIRIEQIDEAFDRMQRSEVRYRFVIDNKSLAA